MEDGTHPPRTLREFLTREIAYASVFVVAGVAALLLVFVLPPYAAGGVAGVLTCIYFICVARLRPEICDGCSIAALLVFAGAAIALSTAAWGEGVKLLHGKKVLAIPVAQAAQHGDAIAFEFSDGRLRLEHSSTHTQTVRTRDKDGVTSTTTSSFIVAPLTGDAWTAADPVPAWGVRDMQAKRFEFGKETLAGMVITPDDSDYKGFRKAVAASALTSAPGAPLLRGFESVEAALAERPREGLWKLAMIYVCFLAGRVGVAGLFFLEGKTK